MELGIDVGDLDQVIQVDAHASVASFLQRLGRTGRRANTRANCTFFCTSSVSLLRSVALLRLAEAGWVEDVQPAGSTHLSYGGHRCVTSTSGGSGSIPTTRTLDDATKHVREYPQTS
jgi:hypothetical protein